MERRRRSQAQRLIGRLARLTLDARRQSHFAKARPTSFRRTHSHGGTDEHTRLRRSRYLVPANGFTLKPYPFSPANTSASFLTRTTLEKWPGRYGRSNY